MKNTTGMLYIGVSNNLPRRLYEHKNDFIDSYTQKYRIHQLVYYELYEDILTAIEREKQLKRWSRKKKIDLISKMNPEFKELVLEM